jgi:hypothetical protein
MVAAAAAGQRVRRCWAVTAMSLSPGRNLPRSWRRNRRSNNSPSPTRPATPSQSINRAKDASVGSRLPNVRAARSSRTRAACTHRARSSSKDFPLSFRNCSGSRGITGVGDGTEVNSRPLRGARWAGGSDATFGPRVPNVACFTGCLANENHADRLESEGQRSNASRAFT